MACVLGLRTLAGFDIFSCWHVLHPNFCFQHKSENFISFFCCYSLLVVRYDPLNDSYHHDMEGNGVICSSVDILPTEFAKEVCYSDPFF